ncbi:MAG: helix-turn-helix transcriptional regulator, partial [Clostridia bacterium]|nr:helix-turn-helix transcriptional regulator [Clostridia bacterium]
MTVGEKIQYFRKKSGLSQEELGSKLLVSRQTVSLWEMDKTLPTVDNLLRLKEIFGVSVDELLDTRVAPEEQEENAEEAPGTMPSESYQFEYTKEELTEYYKNVSAFYLKKVLLAVLLLAVFLVHTLFVEYPDLLAGILLGIFSLNVFANAQTYRKVKKWTAPTNMQRVL